MMTAQLSNTVGLFIFIRGISAVSKFRDMPDSPDLSKLKNLEKIIVRLISRKQPHCIRQHLHGAGGLLSGHKNLCCLP